MTGQQLLTGCEMLETYAKKRDFKKTTEPSGKEKVATGNELTFVIQKHSASRLHYDFRLECGGVLLSWAVPKGPSLDPAIKRLAVMVEDHPVSYVGFEVIIPSGKYCAGEVIVWDTGKYCPDSALQQKLSRKQQEKAIKEGLAGGKLAFTLFGKKLQGSWTLVKTRRSEKEWLLIKHTDKYATSDGDVTEDERSVLSRKTIASLEKSNPDKKEEKKRTVAKRPSRTTSPLKKKRA
jgi:bifunctional non-homologous end joining protein LigD